MYKLSLFILLAHLAIGQEKKDVAVNYMLRGYFYASSSVVDTGSPGGFGGSSNQSRPIDRTIQFAPQGLQLYIDTTQKTTFLGEYKGQTVYLVNATDTVYGFSAMDSRLSIHAEALISNQWKPIEYLPSSWCGNSYHTVYLPAGQYWTFKSPIYTGKLKTKLRYKLVVKGQQIIYSNEVVAYINEQQLTKQQGHESTSIMDPYKN